MKILGPDSPPLKVQTRALSPKSILVRWEPPAKPNGRITVRLYFFPLFYQLLVSGYAITKVGKTSSK